MGTYLSIYMYINILVLLFSLKIIWLAKIFNLRTQFLFYPFFSYIFFFFTIIRMITNLISEIHISIRKKIVSLLSFRVKYISVFGSYISRSVEWQFRNSINFVLRGNSVCSVFVAAFDCSFQRVPFFLFILFIFIRRIPIRLVKISMNTTCMGLLPTNINRTQWMHYIGNGNGNGNCIGIAFFQFKWFIQINATMNILF